MSIFLPVYNTAALEQRISKMSISELQEQHLKMLVTMFDKHGIPFSWTQIFEDVGLAEEYSEIRDPEESVFVPTLDLEATLPQLEEALLKEESFSHSEKQTIRLEFSLLTARGYKIDMSKLIDSYRRPIVFDFNGGDHSQYDSKRDLSKVNDDE